MSKYMPFNAVDDYKIKLQEAKITLGFSPTADVVEVVRCKDCPYCEEVEGVIGTVLYCHYWNKNTDSNGFCNHG